MNPLSLPAEVQIYLLAILGITVIGCFAALQSWKRISEEQKRIKRAEALLVDDAAWDDAYPYDKLNLAAWLREKGIKADSHLGDFIRTCWSAWLGGRPASLTELHVLVSRRERTYGSTRLSSGIAALLLVFGIVGTLSSIKPVLQDFRFQVAVDGSVGSISGTEEESAELESPNDAASVAANTEKVNNLIHSLGNAFWPSLLALVGTILVVSSRGIYSLSLNRFTLELDQFAVDTLIPRYRVPSLSEQYQEVRATLGALTDCLIQREGRFDEVVGNLEKVVTGITPALSGLDAAALASIDAAEKLSSRSKSITESLAKHLGAKSPIHLAIEGFESVFRQTEQSLGNLSPVIEGIGKTVSANQLELESAIRNLTDSIGKIGTEHKRQQMEATSTLDQFKERLGTIPDEIKNGGDKAIDQGLRAVRSGVEHFQEEQKKWFTVATGDLKAVTTAGLAGIVRAAEDLSSISQRVTVSADEIESLKTQTRTSLNALSEAGMAQIALINSTIVSRSSTKSDEINDTDQVIPLPQAEGFPTEEVSTTGDWTRNERIKPALPTLDGTMRKWGHGTPSRAAVPSESEAFPNVRDSGTEESAGINSPHPANASTLEAKTPSSHVIEPGPVLPEASSDNDPQATPSLLKKGWWAISNRISGRNQ